MQTWEGVSVSSEHAFLYTLSMPKALPLGDSLLGAQAVQCVSLRTFSPKHSETVDPLCQKSLKPSKSPELSRAECALVLYILSTSPFASQIPKQPCLSPVSWQHRHVRLCLAPSCFLAEASCSVDRSWALQCHSSLTAPPSTSPLGA